MHEEMIKTLKTVLLAVILLSMFKIYENGGYSNPITIAVLVIMFSLWILFRIELNEEVSQEITEESNNKQVHSIPIDTSEQSSMCTTPTRRLKSLPIVITPPERIDRKVKRNTKFRALVRSRSKSPDHNFKKLA
jgi:Ca2+/Na+ antiporter